MCNCASVHETRNKSWPSGRASSLGVYFLFEIISENMNDDAENSKTAKKRKENTQKCQNAKNRKDVGVREVLIRGEWQSATNGPACVLCDIMTGHSVSGRDGGGGGGGGVGEQMLAKSSPYGT